MGIMQNNLRKIDVKPTPVYKKAWLVFLVLALAIGNGGLVLGHNEYVGTVIKHESSEGFRGRTDRDIIVRLQSGKKIKLTNDNTILRLKRNAATLQKNARVGHKYRFETFGKFEHNISSLHEVK